ncbi:MAG: succinate dehydrogenase, hydrophobic membrane anchor protein [Thiomonas sp.]|uniref:succinate dehydrogenase, hydrophobic membrane anchor protein n=1 Tax=Thiomonas sp. TaxID=2047785 RepID=UPI002A35928A|nr:succinate dehydrogenase, hydrophobic membrane anchor protein [Thiomonas sp.]MDY0330742.1 succinate dehydrogenase, hydrophobic membrane anchor protein [Thiomonas sp.]
MGTERIANKRLVVGAHYGLRDWLAQRVTAAVIAVFTLVLLVYFLAPGSLDYARWHGLFAQQWMKLLTFVTVLALIYHVWVGMRDIWMDYVKPVGVRLLLQIGTILWLLACAGWALQVLWRA